MPCTGYFKNFMPQMELRCDGRLPREMRRMIMSHGIVENRGFVVLRQGNTQVRVSTAPARDRSQLDVCISFSDVSRNEPMNERRVYEMRARILEIFGPLACPDTQVEVCVDVKQDDGSLFSVIVNSITLCFCYCGVSLKDMCLSVTLGDGVDLCSEEEKGFQLCLVVSSSRQKILFLESSGKCQKKAMESAILRGVECCKSIHGTMREYLNKYAV